MLIICSKAIGKGGGTSGRMMANCSRGPGSNPRLNFVFCLPSRYSGLTLGFVLACKSDKARKFLNFSPLIFYRYAIIVILSTVEKRLKNEKQQKAANGLHLIKSQFKFLR